MHSMLFVFLIQGNMHMCMKYLWMGKQEGEGWEKFCEIRGVRWNGKIEVSRYPILFPLSLDK